MDRAVSDCLDSRAVRNCPSAQVCHLLTNTRTHTHTDTHTHTHTHGVWWGRWVVGSRVEGCRVCVWGSHAHN